MSKIEWTDVTWNPVTGCDKISPGCKNCYAEKMHRRLMHIAPHKYTESFLGNIEVHDDELDRPFQWKKPKKVFVNSMSDLFHQDVPFFFIYQVFQTMLDENGRHHTYQILTKRPEIMRHFFQWLALYDYAFYDAYLQGNHHIWLGVSCENQKTANERIPQLITVPARIRFLSCEPLLGDIKLSEALNSPRSAISPETISWIICGGESGPHARPMHPHWLKSLYNQAIILGIPFFFKQWGEWQPTSDDKKKGTFFQWPGTEFEGYFDRVGKSKSGNHLNGEQHLNFPTPILKQ